MIQQHAAKVAIIAPRDEQTSNPVKPKRPMN